MPERIDHDTIRARDKNWILDVHLPSDEYRDDGHDGTDRDGEQNEPDTAQATGRASVICPSTKLSNGFSRFVRTPISSHGCTGVAVQVASNLPDRTRFVFAEVVEEIGPLPAECIYPRRTRKHGYVRIPVFCQ